MTVRERLTLNFVTMAGIQKNMSVNDPCPDVTAQDIQQAANAFIGADMFDSEVGPLDRLAGVEHITVRTIPVLV